MTISVIVAVRDAGPSLREHVCSCRQSTADLPVEIVVVDNQSVDGCCNGLPRDVLIVQTERVEAPARLWALGASLAQGDGLLWLPRLLSYPPKQFRAVVLDALGSPGAEERLDAGRESPPLSWAAAWSRPAFFAPRTRSRIERLRRVPVLGNVLSQVAARGLRLAVPSGAGDETDGGTTASTGPGVELTSAAIRQGDARHVSLGADDVRAPSPSTGQALAESMHPVRSASNARAAERGGKRLSVIITAHNEGAEVLRTVRSVRASTRVDHEIIVVDDGSTDGSCAGLEALGVRVITHPKRVGVAYSRDAASRVAIGDVLAFLDAHQRVDPGCFDCSSELAALHGAIVSPPCRPLHRAYAVSYGATFKMCPKRGFFSGHPLFRRPRQKLTRVSTLRSPGYLIPRSVYPRVAWVAGLRGWGASEAAIAVKAFFTQVDLLVADTGATEHLFRKTIPYETDWEGVWRNHALIARVCFDDRTWTRYWLPEVFQAKVTEETLRELDSSAVLAQRDAFLGEKVRPDREFWRGLLRIPEPRAIR
jgi:glycosyltransferase involved in cell wall biosynthesis